MKRRTVLLTALAVAVTASAATAQNEADAEATAAPRTGVYIVPPPGSQPQAPKPKEAAPTLPESLIVGLPPVGAVIAWLKSLPDVPPLPGHWVECNGQVIDAPGSPLHGVQAPNLNGFDDEPRRFLRGAPGSGETGGTEQHRHGPALVQRTGDRRTNVAQRDDQPHLPPYYEVTWILRVR